MVVLQMQAMTNSLFTLTILEILIIIIIIIIIMIIINSQGRVTVLK